MSNSNQKRKSKLNMTTKDPSRKQIIIFMSTNNTERVIIQSNIHISNINRLLKDIKSEIYANFICSNKRSIILTTNNITSTLDMQTIEKYIKNLNNIDSNEIISPRLFQSKSYLKILDIPYLIKDTNLPIFADIIKIVIKSTYIFNNTVLAFRPQIIKVSLKLDMAIIWVDI